MSFVAEQVDRLVLLSILITIDFFFLYASQGILRVLRIPVNWVTWLIGTLLIVASVLTSVFMLVQGSSLQGVATNDALLGVFSFLVVVYSLSQWTVRQWYVLIKKRTIPFVTQQSRTMLLFLRKHHQFFGWVVAATAVAHAISYLTVITHIGSRLLITGIVGLVLLVPVVGIGYWIEIGVRKKRLTQKARLVHLITGVVFFIVIMIHIGV